MPSASLLRWQNDRLARLREIEAHCLATVTAVPPNPLLADESLKSFVLLLSGHFQGFCRDLYSECVEKVRVTVAPGLQALVQNQFLAELKLNSNNPTIDTLKTDFARFNVKLDFNVNSAITTSGTHLGHLNKWRNHVAHQKPLPPTGVPALTLASVQMWLASCDRLATWLDGVLYNEMMAHLGVAPW